MHRLFVALRPPPAIRRQLAAVQDGIVGARWQDDEQLHLTVRFIGPVERPQAEDVAAALAQVHAPAPQVAISGVGRFASPLQTRRGGEAVWAGLAPHDALAHLHRKVDQACARAGLAPERRAYLPHVTLARLSRAAAGDPSIERWLARHAGLGSERFALAHIILYESHLGREGARYEPVMRWPLAAPPQPADSREEIERCD